MKIFTFNTSITNVKNLTIGVSWQQPYPTLLPLLPNLFYLTLLRHSFITSPYSLYTNTFKLTPPQHNISCEFGTVISFYYIISFKWVIILLLPIYIFLYMTYNKIFQFHFILNSCKYFK